MAFIVPILLVVAIVVLHIEAARDKYPHFGAINQS